MKLYTYTSNLIIADKPTVNGRIYTKEVCLDIKSQIEACYLIFDYSRALVYDMTKIPVTNGGFGTEVYNINEVNDRSIAIGDIQYVEFTDRFIFHIADLCNEWRADSKFNRTFNWNNANIQPMMLLEGNVEKIDGLIYVTKPSFNKILMIPTLGN